MIKIISRKSDLAIIQACLVGDAIKDRKSDMSIEYLYKDTRGDIDLTTPLSQLPEIGVFTSDLRESLINEEADIAVHSWKDLPINLTKGTKIIGTLPRADMRDIIFFKKKNLDKIEKNKTLNLLTSSPRREYNLNTFLKNALPYKIEKISFDNIRGNIPTRLNKYFFGDADGIVLAKAALDRLLNNNTDLSKDIRKILDSSNWLIPPLSENPCAPAQGAIAIEVKDGRNDIVNLIREINDTETFESVQIERNILSSYGGGCHQKIGVSYEKRDFGDVLTLKGITDDNISLNQRKIERKEESKNSWYNIDLNKIYPPDLKNYNFFSRNNLKDHIEEISSLRNKNILASRANVLDGKIKIDSSNILWSSGVKTWFQLVKKGYWVNGSFDSLGENEENLKFIANNDWVKLTHKDSLDFFINDRLFTYRLTKNKITEDLSEKTHFYWMSGSAFEYAIEQFPIILEKFHSCGPGNTYEIIKKNVTEDRIKIFLNYEDWKDEITNGKS
ncbi:MAG: hydroxymethylbilane synthase [Pseudomonadota bacterium]|nr:hydroxymethylbilane synthase [Pseudomonadota bacterium]